MSYIDCEIDWLRAVIDGTIRFRKCPTCDNKGREYQAYDENGEPCSNYDETAWHDICENCGGVAYIEIPS